MVINLNRFYSIIHGSQTSHMKRFPHGNEKKEYIGREAYLHLNTY